MRARAILFIISLMLLSVVMVFGQEEPTPIPTETPTELPTETLTPSPLPPPPTDTPTIVPTEIPTETVTASPLPPPPSEAPTMVPILTETPTETATETATPSATGTDGSMTPTVTETSTSTATDGAEVTLTPTSTETLTPSNLVIAYEQHFEDDSDDMLLLATNATRIYHGTSYGMALPSDGAPFYLRTIGSTDAAVETRFLSSGTFTLHLFVTVQSQYTIHVNSMGQVLAFHDAELLASGQVSTLPSPAWRMLYVTLSQETLSVFVDGEHAFDVADAAISTTRLIAFSGAPDAVIDDVRLWAAGDAALQSTMYSPPSGIEDNPALYAALFVQGDGLIYQPSNTTVIYFTSGSTSGLAARPDTSQIALRSHVTARMAPSLSPNGSWLVSACTVRAGLIDDICLVEVTGSATNGAIIRLTADTQADIGAVWSPDGIRIAFATSPSAGVTNVHIVQPDLVNFTVPAIERVIPNCTMPTWAGEYIFCQAIGTGVARGIRYYHVPTGESGDATTGFDGLPDAAPYGTGIRLAYTRYSVQNPQPWQVGTTEWGFFDPATRSFIREGGFPLPPEDLAMGYYLPVLSVDGTVVIIRSAEDNYNYFPIPDVDFQEIYAYYLTSPIPTHVSVGGGLIDHISWQESGFPLNWVDLAPLFAPPTATPTPTATETPTQIPICGSSFSLQAQIREMDTAYAAPLCQIAPETVSFGECLSGVGNRSTLEGVNIRSSMSMDDSAIQIGDYVGDVILDGQVLDENGTAQWFRVSRYLNEDGAFQMLAPPGWISSTAYGAQIVCNYGPDKDPTYLREFGIQADLIHLNSLGTPEPSATPTPTITPTPTLDVTLTPTPTPTLYPTLTPTITPVPPPTFAICSDRVREQPWIVVLCLQGWYYLSDDERTALTTEVDNVRLSTEFTELDAWWLRNIGRGIADVPPQVWETDSINQCAGNPACSGIVHDTAFLFRNMWRIGIDYHDEGLGQAGVVNNLPDLSQQQLWFLPNTDIPLEQRLQFWGWVQNEGDYACERLRSPFMPSDGFDDWADVCWVCQDLPTLLYARRGFSLQDTMPGNLSGSYNAAYFRYVPAVVDFGEHYGHPSSAVELPDGSDPNYRIGEMVFTSVLPTRLGVYDTHYNHVGIVVRGATTGMTFEQALDYVLIAQISYSSQGFFSSVSDPGPLMLSPENSRGRYEVITLRTYLVKHLLGLVQPLVTPAEVQNDSVLRDRAKHYLRHWAPLEILSGQ